MSETEKKTEKKGKETSSSGPERAAAAKPRRSAAAHAKAEHAPSKQPPAAANAAAPKQIRIRQVKSGICTPENHKQTLRALGLRRIRHEVVRPDTSTVRGQIHKVRHLVTVVEGA